MVTIVALKGWKKNTPALPGVPETLFSGVRSGLRYARHSPLMRALIIRNLSFSVCASALWALLPVIARDQLSLGAGGFGLLSGGFGPLDSSSRVARSSLHGLPPLQRLVRHGHSRATGRRLVL